MSSDHARLLGLTAAAHTPFAADGSLDLAVVERQAEHLARSGVAAVFVGGTTGESHSLTADERLRLARRWVDATRAGGPRVVVHVGANCLDDSRALAGDAEQAGASAISALAPSYFKPRSLEALVAWCEAIAAAAPALPFYFYDIPALTGVHLGMPEFLDAARSRIPNLAGIKFTNSDLMAYQLCLRADDAKWDVPFGCDEYLLAALALGARGAVGSSYNFAAPIYLRLIEAFERGDLEQARVEQFRSVRLIRLLASFGYMAAAKAVMRRIGLDVGPPRPPHDRLTAEQESRLFAELDRLEPEARPTATLN
ncbi:MAG: dihydrodipicolinate synthase family protein [Isosphaeraceae bacterium]|nr:dihydrodipicolinate synthase family protein [Isosphaeraceae bacterium]